MGEEKPLLRSGHTAHWYCAPVQAGLLAALQLGVGARRLQPTHARRKSSTRSGALPRVRPCAQWDDMVCDARHAAVRMVVLGSRPRLPAASAGSAKTGGGSSRMVGQQNGGGRQQNGVVGIRAWHTCTCVGTARAQRCVGVRVLKCSTFVHIAGPQARSRHWRGEGWAAGRSAPCYPALHLVAVATPTCGRVRAARRPRAGLLGLAIQ